MFCPTHIEELGIDFQCQVDRGSSHRATQCILSKLVQPQQCNVQFVRRDLKTSAEYNQVISCSSGQRGFQYKQYFGRRRTIKHKHTNVQ